MRLLEDKHPRQKFALTVGRGQFDIKVDAAKRPCARWTSNAQRSDGQSPRANPPRGAKERPHQPGRKRAGTLDTDGVPNVPIRQKEGGLRSPLA